MFSAAPLYSHAVTGVGQDRAGGPCRIRRSYTCNRHQMSRHPYLAQALAGQRRWGVPVPLEALVVTLGGGGGGGVGLTVRGNMGCNITVGAGQRGPRKELSVQIGIEV